MKKPEWIVIAFLVFCPHRQDTSSTDSYDFNFADSLLRSYLCTGNIGWWRNVGRNRTDDKLTTLRFLAHASVAMFCPTYRLTVRNVKFFIKDARKIVNDKDSSLNKIRGCFWEAMVNRFIIPFLCPRSDEDESFVTILRDTHELFCADQKDKKKNKIKSYGCGVANVILRNRLNARKVFGPFVCDKDRQDRLQKRQYDVTTLTNGLMAGCSVQHLVVFKRGQPLPLLYFGDFYCCLVHHGNYFK